MRTKINKQPPDREIIERIVAKGPTAADKQRRRDLLQRLQKSCYLGTDNRPLTAAERLLEQYRRDGLVLFLGAGVSLQSGIPNWRCLAERVLRKLGLDHGEVASVCPSLITQFDLASQQADSPEKFIRVVYECLYQGLESKRLIQDIPKTLAKQCGWPRWPKVLNSLRKNRTLEAIGEFLIAGDERKNGGLRANHQIHGVLTTNTDNLLEIYCYAKTNGKRRLLTMVDRASVGDHPDTISIHHLHGSLDVRGENFLRDKLPTDLLPDLVFRESDYYEVIADPSAFVNHTPQSYFRTFNVLFIGISLDDPNIRRWLYQSYRERRSQRSKYLRELYKPDYKDAEYEAALESVRHFWIRTKPERVDDRDRPVPCCYVESSMKNLGVQLVWCADYAELQNRISELKTKGLNPRFGHPTEA